MEEADQTTLSSSSSPTACLTCPCRWLPTAVRYLLRCSLLLLIPMTFQLTFAAWASPSLPSSTADHLFPLAEHRHLPS